MNRLFVSRCTRTFFAVAICTGLGLAQSDVLVPTGSVWKYLDDGSNQGTAWRGLGFVDTAWAEGPAQLGYGDGDESTVVGFGPNASNKYVTTYFRHSFNVPNASIYQAITVNCLRDDGAVVYLNGTELMRTYMPGGTISYTTLASATASGTEEDIFTTTSQEANLLVDGTNVLAVEIHQRTVTSSDISMDLEFIAHQDPLTSRGPYLQKGTDSSVVVRWRTLPASNSMVWYGSAPGSLTSTVFDGTLKVDHEIELTGLSPDTTYYYAIGDSGGMTAGNDQDHFFLTHPTPGTTKPTRIWVLGDSGTADNAAAAVRNAYYDFTGTTHTDLWLMLGDNAYTFGTDDEYQGAVFDMYPEMLRKSVLWSTRGNHESSASTYFGAFTMPTAAEAGGVASGSEAYYSFDYANIHFVCLDSTGSSTAVGGAMWNWAQADLAATTQDWIIVFWHHPPYSKGSHNSDTESSLIAMRQNFLPLLESSGVDAVLCGHSHSYERSYLIDGHYGPSGTLTSAMILDDGSGQEENDGAYYKADGGNRGTVYTVAGSSGKVSGGPLNHPVMFRNINGLGSVVIDVDGGRMDMKFLRHTGVVADHWTFLGPAYTGSYCTALSTFEGCIVTMQATGMASMTDTNPFLLDGLQVPNNKFGLLFYGFGPANQPLFSGRLCVDAPQTRTDVQNSGPGLLPCEGSFTYDFNARIQSGIDPLLTAGTSVYSQYWFRDTGGGAGLSNGYQFVIGP